MTTIVGRNVKVEVASAYGSPLTVSAITVAKPPVLTSTAHGQAAKAVGYLNLVQGMVELEGQAVRVLSPATDTFSLEGLDSTQFPAFTGTCQLFMVTQWQTLAKATSFAIGGGAGSTLDDTSLLDTITQEIQGLLAAQTISIGINAETVNSTAAQTMEDAAFNQQYVTVRCTMADGAVRIARGQPSMPGENITKAAIATGTMSMTVKGRVVKGA